MKSVVLLSGGLDSAVNLCVAAGRTTVLLALTFDYGQRAALKEISAASMMCAGLGLRHEIVRLPWLGNITRTALVDRDKPLPAPCAADLEPGTESARSAAEVWVPNRNAVFVSIGASWVEALAADLVVAGFNAEEGATFPDNSAEFVTAMNSLLSLSTMSKVKLVSYTMDLDKKAIVELGLDCGAPLDKVWSCYEGGHRHCRKCESCVRLRRALETAGAWDGLESSL